MQLSTILSASFLAVASAQNTSPLPTINLGYFAYPHGNQFVAWSPFTPTTTQELDEVCNERGAIKGTATWSSIRTYNTYVLKPICRNPFNITDDATNTTYYNLELACVDDNISLSLRPEVTAVVDVSINKTVETCVPVPTDSDVYSRGCSRTPSEGLNFAFSCSPKSGIQEDRLASMKWK